MNDASAVAVVTAGATVALALLTLAYTISTVLLFIESRSARLEASRPVLHLSPQVLGVNHPIARITNVGRGYARNIRGDLFMTVADHEVWRYTWHMDLMAPGDYHDFMLQASPDSEPSRNVRDVAAEERRFHMDLRFVDAQLRTTHAIGVADWKDIADHLFGAQMLLKPDRLHDMERHLKEIADAMHSARDSDGLKIITYREQQKRDEERLAWIRQQAEEQKPPEPPATEG